MAVTNPKRTLDTKTETRLIAEPTAKIPVEIVSTPSTQTKGSSKTTTTAKTSYEKRMRELPPVVRLRRKLASNAKRMAKIIREAQRWTNAPKLGEQAAALGTALAAMLAVASDLPDDFKPNRERQAGSRKVSVGMKVGLVERVATRYDGMIDAEERTTLEVVSIAKGLVSVRSACGARLVLPVRHVTRLASEVKADALQLVSASADGAR